MPDYPITIERKTEDGDPVLGTDDKWETVCTPYATFEAMGGRETVEGDQTKGQKSHKLKFRWGPSLVGFTSADRIKFRGRVLELTSVINTGERNEWIEVMAIERGQEDRRSNDSWHQ